MARKPKVLTHAAADEARRKADDALRARHYSLDWTDLQKEIRAEYAKRHRPNIIFPSRAVKLAWLADGARTGVTPPLPEGAYYE